MCKSLLNVSVFLIIIFAAVSYTFAQTSSETVKEINFRYSQNPKTNIKSANRKADSNADKVEGNLPVLETNSPENVNQTIAVKTFDIAKRANKAALSPTEIYKIGIGDILIIGLQNAPGSAANYFTVLSDGAIDYPLAGEMVSVQGLTTEEIEILLEEKIKLYKNPQVVVKVREYASHTFTVLGLVEKAGEKFLQREAVPLYVVRAEAVTQPQAKIAIIKRADSVTESVNLDDSKSDNILIFSGDIVEFKAFESASSDSQTPQFYFIGGNINAAGQKNFHSGITLTQAILASGGLKKSGVRKVIIRRKNQEGLLSPLEFDLNSIKNGKQVDPVLQSGDTIEIFN